MNDMQKLLVIQFQAKELELLKKYKLLDVNIFNYQSKHYYSFIKYREEVSRLWDKLVLDLKIYERKYS